MAGVGLGQLLLALDATMVSLVDAPRGLDQPVASAALIDSDDVRLGLAAAAGSADVFFLLGVGDDEALRWIDTQARDRVPVAVFVKEPSDALVGTAVAAGSAVVAVDPRARWERLYQLVNHVLEHHGDRADAADDSGTDLFGLAQSLAERIHGMVSIENAQSQVLAYSASNDEADELRRLSILGRAGPPEHLEWIGQWGIFDALRSGTQVVRVAERPELGLRPRLAVGIHQPDPGCPATAGVRRDHLGAAGRAAAGRRRRTDMAARPSTQARRLQQLLGVTDSETLAPVDLTAIAAELGLAADGCAALIGWAAAEGASRHTRLTDVIALSASAFRHDAHVAGHGSPSRRTGRSARGCAAPSPRCAPSSGVPGLSAVAAARAEVDRVLDSAERHPLSFGQVTSLAEARTTVLLDEIVTLVGRDERLVDPRIVALHDREPVLAQTLRTYLDAFGDIAAAAHALRVHPNTVRYRVRRIEKLLSVSLADPEVRLLFALALRVAER